MAQKDNFCCLTDLVAFKKSCDFKIDWWLSDSERVKQRKFRGHCTEFWLPGYIKSYYESFIELNKREVKLKPDGIVQVVR